VDGLVGYHNFGVAKRFTQERFATRSYQKMANFFDLVRGFIKREA